MQIIDGKKLAVTLQQEMFEEVAAWTSKGMRKPHLAAILVGDNVASATYVRNKIRSCERTGVDSSLVHLPEDITEVDLLAEVQKLNNDPTIDGFIVQLPLPKHIDEDKIILAIDPSKDVDGFHPYNLGMMTLGTPTYLPATPFGILKMLERYNIETSGKHCVVIGRSNIVGTPMSILLSRKATPGNCTVTLVHSRTKNLPELVRQADIVVAAIGRASFVTADMLKDGVVLIDVGINSVEDASRKRGYRLVGDIDFESCAPKASFITPVPGGVGPMTVTALIMNTLQAYKHHENI